MNSTIFDIKNKIILITGAAGILGREYIKIMTSMGAKIVALDINENSLKSLKDNLEPNQRNLVTTYCVDITNKEQVSETFEKIKSDFGTLDVLINNAAFNCPVGQSGSNFEEFENYPLDLWQKSINVNLTGTFLSTQNALKMFLQNEKKNGIRGKIINVSSIYGVGAPIQSMYENIISKEGNRQFKKPADYSVTKSGILNFTKYLASYYGKDGIITNTITLGGVFQKQETNFLKEYEQRTPLKRMADSKDFNGAMVFLCSDASNYMTGSNLIIDGGWTSW